MSVWLESGFRHTYAHFTLLHPVAARSPGEESYFSDHSDNQPQSRKSGDLGRGRAQKALGEVGGGSEEADVSGPPAARWQPSTTATTDRGPKDRGCGATVGR